MNILIPGLYNSNSEHWQSLWEKEYPNDFYRINQNNWETPNCADWIQQIDEELKQFDLTEVILIGHSIGCIAIANWSQQYKHIVKGALLVAPADTERPDFPASVTEFNPIAHRPFPFPSLVVTSTNDPYIDTERAMFLTRKWGSEFVAIYNAGHINDQSGYGNWPFGLELIEKVKSLSE